MLGMVVVVGVDGVVCSSVMVQSGVVIRVPTVLSGFRQMQECLVVIKAATSGRWNGIFLMSKNISIDCLRR